MMTPLPLAQPGKPPSASTAYYLCRWKGCGGEYPTFKASVKHMRCHLRYDSRRTQSELEERQSIVQIPVESLGEETTRMRSSPARSPTIPFTSLNSPECSTSNPLIPSSPSFDTVVPDSRRRARSSATPSPQSKTPQEAELQLTSKDSKSKEPETDSSSYPQQSEAMRKGSVSGSLPTGHTDSPSNPFLDLGESPSTPATTSHYRIDSPPTMMGQVDDSIIPMLVPTTTFFETTNSPQQAWYTAPPRRRRRLPSEGGKERKRRRSSTKHGSSKLRSLNAEESPIPSTPLRSSVSFTEP